MLNNKSKVMKLLSYYRVRIAAFALLPAMIIMLSLFLFYNIQENYLPDAVNVFIAVCVLTLNVILDHVYEIHREYVSLAFYWYRIPVRVKKENINMVTSIVRLVENGDLNAAKKLMLKIR